MIEYNGGGGGGGGGAGGGGVLIANCLSLVDKAPANFFSDNT